MVDLLVRSRWGYIQSQVRGGKVEVPGREIGEKRKDISAKKWQSTLRASKYAYDKLLQFKRLKSRWGRMGRALLISNGLGGVDGEIRDAPASSTAPRDTMRFAPLIVDTTALYALLFRHVAGVKYPARAVIPPVLVNLIVIRVPVGDSVSHVSCFVGRFGL